MSSSSGIDTRDAMHSLVQRLNVCFQKIKILVETDPIMDPILAIAAKLDVALLENNEEEYEDIALKVVASLKKIQLPDTATLEVYIEQLDPETLTIPYVFLLSSLIDSMVAAQNSRNLPQEFLPEGKLWPEITRGLLTFDPVQVRYVGAQFQKIIEMVYAGGQQTNNFVPAIQLIENVIQRLDHSSSTLTVSHYYFVKLCVLARAYNEATVVLNRPIYHVPTSESTKPLEKRLSKYLCSQHESSVAYINPQTGLSGKITSRIYLEYYFLSALCFIGIKDWKKAEEFLEVVLTTPTSQNVASRIQVEAYKKWLLIGLLINGEGRELPRSVSANAAKHIRALGKAYECIVDAFKSNNMDTIQAEVNEGIEEWTQDRNLGLMGELLAAFRKFAVQRLSKTYAALPIELVARLTSPTPTDANETFNYLNMLITTGALQAQLSPPRSSGNQPATSLGFLRFLPPEAIQKSEAEIERTLAVKTAELLILKKHIQNYEHQLEVNKDYVEFLQKAKKGRDQDKKASDKNAASKPFGIPPGPGMGMGMDVDEEMMDDWN